MKTLLLLLTFAGSTLFAGNQSYGQCSGPINYSIRSQGQGGTFSNGSHWFLNTPPSPLNQVVVKNDFPMTVSSNFTLSGSNCLVIEPNATLTISTNTTLTLDGSYTLINQGTIQGGGTLNIGSGCTFTNNGTLSTSLINAGNINGTGSITIPSGKSFTNHVANSSISNTIVNNGTMFINSSVINSGPITNNSSIQVGGGGLTNTSVISGPGTIVVTSGGSAVINEGTISGVGSISLGTGSKFFNQATGSITGGNATATMTASGADTYFRNLGSISGSWGLNLSNSADFYNMGSINLTGTAINLTGAYLTNSGTFTASSDILASVGAAVNTSGTMSIPNVSLAASTFTIQPTGVVNVSNQFVLQSGFGQLNIYASGSQYGQLNAYDVRINSGSFTNNGVIATSRNFTNNSSSTVYNNHNIIVQGNFVNTTSFMNNGPVAPGGGIIVYGDFTNSGTFEGTDGSTEVTGYSRNSNGGVMSGTQRFCDLGNPPGGLDLNAGKVSLTVKGCGGINPLPVTLISFEGKQKEGSVLLEWATSMEKNSDKFIIEKSGPTLEFTGIGSVKSAGNSNTLQTYSFTDESGLNGVTYYRLKQVDFDGTFQYSKIISLKGKMLPSMEVYPNPATANFTIKAPQEVANASVELVNTVGAVVYKKEVGAIKTSQALDISFENQKPTAGLYLVRIISDGKAVAAPQSIIIK